MGSVLLVETDPEAKELRAVLRSTDHDVIIASSTRDAFAKLSEGGIDVVVVDAYDPRVGVVELARNMNDLPDSPPLILVSSSRHAPEISARIGAAAFLTKPCDASELIAIIKRHAGELRPVRVMPDLPEDFGDDEPTGPARQYGP